MQNRITLIFTADDPSNSSQTIYDSRSFTLIGKNEEIAAIGERANGDDEAHELFETIEDQYGTLDIGGSGNDFLWGFQTTGETEPKDFDTITQMVRQFFEDKFGATLSPTIQTISNNEPH